MFEKSVAVMGGCGHVGLPLAIALAEAGFRTAIYDVNESACRVVRSGKLPFDEEGAGPVLPRVLQSGRLVVSSDPAVMSEQQFVICSIGTPVDEFLNPTVHRLLMAIDAIRGHLRDGQVLVLRSTLCPRTSERVQQLLLHKGLAVDVAVCPERVAQGRAYVEIKQLPQIISAFNERGLAAARFLFEQLGVSIVEVLPLEAELVKLFNNVWRYLTFAIANEFFTIANECGLDYYRIHRAISHDYPRGRDIPQPGFAAGPCLFKDTMQLASFASNRFFLGHAAMLVNEGLPAYLVERMARKHDLGRMTVGILGMTFKADCDDARDSLGFKFRKILATRARRVVCSDACVDRSALLAASSQLRPEEILSTEELIAASDLVIIGVPHAAYRNLDMKGKLVVDIWNSQGRGAAIG